MAIKPRNLHKSETPAQATPDTPAQWTIEVHQYEEAALLTLRGHSIVNAYMGNNGRVTFVFNADAAPDLWAYRSGQVTVEPAAFVSAMMRMKSLIFTLRQETGARGR